MRRAQLEPFPTADIRLLLVRLFTLGPAGSHSATPDTGQEEGEGALADDSTDGTS